MALTVFENHNLDFNVSLIKMKRQLQQDVIRDVVDEVVELNNTSVLDLQLTESSLSMGAKGLVTIANKFNILERLNISTNSPDNLYVAVEINDLELAEVDTGDENKVITMIGLVSSTSSSTQGPVENIITFTFEEALVAHMKLAQVQFYFGKGQDVNLGRVLDDTNIVEFVEEFNRTYPLKNEDNITAPSATPNVQSSVLYQDSHEVSVYDAAQKLISESGIGNNGPEKIGNTPYGRIVNGIGADGEVKRLFKYAPFMSDRHRAFVFAVAGNKDSGNYGDVYTEKFYLGPFADTPDTDPNTSLYNRIERYNINRADINNLRQTIWGDYNINKTDASPNWGIFTPKHLTFPGLQTDFCEREIGSRDLEVNLPLLDGKFLRDFHLTANSYSNSVIATNTITKIHQKITNKVFKSFFTLNESIEFIVKGQVYRQPNKFIWIERGEDEPDYKKLWYVNSITHKFSEGKYQTKIIATKIFGDTSYEALEKNS